MPLPLLGVRFSSCHIHLHRAVQCFKGSVVQAIHLAGLEPAAYALCTKHNGAALPLSYRRTSDSPHER